ncbi:KTSC domain-containing protein [bacterium]|nr:KTSC domain-containing protein [bacterium]
MDRKNVDSSMIRSIGYDSGSSTLEVEFNSGAVWQYFDFPESLWYEFESAASHGKFFHREIKNQYSESRVA